MQNRLNKLRDALANIGADALITERDVNRRYLSGFTGSTGWVIVTEKDAFLVTDFRYIDQAQEQCPDFTVVNNQRKAVEAIAQVLKQAGVKRLAFESSLSYGSYAEWSQAFDGVELVPTSGVLEKLRMYKEASEVEIVRKAVKIADDAFQHILGYIKPGVSESDIALELEFFMRRQGASGIGFDIIVASGPRGALPHGRASEKLIQAGELVTLDFGAQFQGYNSDITRTVAVGEPSAKMKEIYDIVLKAQIAGVNALRPGITGKEADAVTRDIITAAGYGDAYGHSAGHGLGMDVHELPNLSTVSPFVLEPGMLVTMEPGIYVSGLGGVRIEDDVLITEEGHEVLTQSTKELLILPV
ncbi:aminopeptidase P family protein [Brevibacillus composti]|uniref:Aminopeptidase P family protein n=1 Tax=Brevibacillus composti TaxID=2796470 RepID=A0A7T5EHW3_9BACL|nr:Xaa-Pro peptidase family protein [Brevibacillus composti]QQE72910.1 aminopeptidase P family protein [Brevibacillus composti]QUO39988.1 aminopeptidase P family protein [Brevibacillus composti]